MYIGSNTDSDRAKSTVPPSGVTATSFRITQLPIESAVYAAARWLAGVADVHESSASSPSQGRGRCRPSGSSSRPSRSRTAATGRSRPRPGRRRTASRPGRSPTATAADRLRTARSRRRTLSWCLMALRIRTMVSATGGGWLKCSATKSPFG
jgi:hypothetical protein